MTEETVTEFLNKHPETKKEVERLMKLWTHKLSREFTEILQIICGIREESSRIRAFEILKDLVENSYFTDMFLNQFYLNKDPKFLDFLRLVSGASNNLMTKGKIPYVK